MSTDRFATDDFGMPAEASLAELVDTLEHHMTGRDPLLPTPAMVSFYPPSRSIGIAPQEPDLVTALSELLLWTYTMDQPGAVWCRRADGSFAVLTEGRTSNGTLLVVSGGGQYSECLDLLSLPVGPAQAVSINTLNDFWDQIYAADQADTTKA